MDETRLCRNALRKFESNMVLLQYYRSVNAMQNVFQVYCVKEFLFVDFCVFNAKFLAFLCNFRRAPLPGGKDKYNEFEQASKTLQSRHASGDEKWPDREMGTD